MSIRIMSEVWKTKLTTSEKMVLLVIADHASDDGTEAWPSQRLIGEKASLSIRTVQTTINRLQEKGWLHMEKRAGGSLNCRDDRRPNKYTIHLGKLRGENSSSRRQRGEIDDTNEAKLTALTGRNLRPMNHTKQSPLETPSISENQFEEFYKNYPRKTAKGAAKKAWDKLCPTDQEKALEGALAYSNDPHRDPTFTAYPATWLNAQRWLDEDLPPSKLSPEEMQKKELEAARLRSQLERERSQRIGEEFERMKAAAVPMPANIRELLRG